MLPARLIPVLTAPVWNLVVRAGGQQLTQDGEKTFKYTCDERYGTNVTLV